MTMEHSARADRRWAQALLLATLTTSALPVAACELDGLSHGYGPMSALFAGAHRYQSLNGLEEEEAPPAEASPPPTSVSSTPPTPRRSFVAWAKTKPKAPGSAEAPASWVPRSADPPRAAPQGAQPEQGEQGQRPPGGGPLP